MEPGKRQKNTHWWCYEWYTAHVLIVVARNGVVLRLPRFTHGCADDIPFVECHHQRFFFRRICVQDPSKILQVWIFEICSTFQIPVSFCREGIRRKIHGRKWISRGGAKIFGCAAAEEGKKRGICYRFSIKCIRRRPKRSITCIHRRSKRSKMSLLRNVHPPEVQNAPKVVQKVYVLKAKCAPKM